MGKLLRGLVVVLLLLSIAALVLAHILFDRREVLRARVDTMQQAIERLARTIESESPEEPAVSPDFPERDISPVTAEPEPSPRREQFWRNYQIELEESDQDLMDLSDQRSDLLTLYRVDAQGNRISHGPGTMHGVIDELISRAADQYNTLNNTRQQLGMLREELVSVIEDYNEMRNQLRSEMANVVAAEEERDEYRDDAESARQELAQANERSRELELRIDDMEQEELILREELDTLQVRNEELDEEIDTLRARVSELEGMEPTETGDIPTGVARLDIDTGDKGTVVSVDHDYMFIVMELTDAFMEELTEAAVDGRLPLVDLYVEREEDDRRAFISKVRLIQIKRDEQLAIGDIRADWHQEDIRRGDKVVYQ